jgi:Diacylglycerol acyltransferase
VVTKHSGFIRMALQEGAHLVPILSFGEVDIMDNVRYPILQQWFLKTIGVAFPHQPYGLYYLPIPRKHRNVYNIDQLTSSPLREKKIVSIIDLLSSLFIVCVRSSKSDSGCRHSYTGITQCCP